MNSKHQAFVDAWVATHDRANSLSAAGYQTENKHSALVQFRRLMQREDIKAAIEQQDSGDFSDKKARFMSLCWDKINDDMVSTKDQTSMARLFATLSGWDKDVKHDDDELMPPTFQFMPFQPKDCGPVVPESV